MATEVPGPPNRLRERRAPLPSHEDARGANARIDHALKYGFLRSLDIELEQVDVIVAELSHHRSDRPAFGRKADYRRTGIDDDRVGHVTWVRWRVERLDAVRVPYADGHEGGTFDRVPRIGHELLGSRRGIKQPLPCRTAAGQPTLEVDVLADPHRIADRGADREPGRKQGQSEIQQFFAAGGMDRRPQDQGLDMPPRKLGNSGPHSHRGLIGPASPSPGENPRRTPWMSTCFRRCRGRVPGRSLPSRQSDRMPSGEACAGRPLARSRG